MKTPATYVRPAANHGRPRWLADLRAYGAGRRFFETEAAALAHVRQFLADRKPGEPDLAAELRRLPHHERLELALLLDERARHGFTFADVRRAWQDSARPASNVPLGELERRFLAAKEAKGVRPRHLANLRKGLRRFLANRRHLPAAAVTAEDIRRFLTGNGWAPATQRSLWVDLRTFFAFGVREGLLRASPAAAVEAPLLDDKPPGILPVADVRRLLDVCQRTDPGLLPVVAACLFGGLRTQEALRLDAADLREGFIEVKAHKAKTRQRRLVPITPQLRAWLDAGRRAGDALPPVNFDKRWRRVRRLAGVFRGWPQNAARHSFVSYHCALHGDYARTAALAGHGEQMLIRHYRALVTPAEAAAFFALVPDPAAVAEGIAARRRPRRMDPEQARRAAQARWRPLRGVAAVHDARTPPASSLGPPCTAPAAQNLADLGGTAMFCPPCLPGPST